MTQSIVFSRTAQAMVSGHIVRMALGVRFDFADGVMRVWTGQGQHIAGDGTSWIGLGGLASIDGLEASANMQTEAITLTLSGLQLAANMEPDGKSFLDLARDEVNQIRGRTCAVYALMRDGSEQAMDTPYLIGLYLMDSASLVVDSETRTISIPLKCEPLFATKHIPPIALVTDQDQQNAYPGDKVFERVALLTGRQTVIWAS